MKRIKKIAVARVNGLGDFIFAVPALIALGETFPDAEIVYLGKQWHQEFLLERKQIVDRVIVVPPIQGVGMDEAYINNQQELEVFYQKLRKEKFYIAVQLHGGGKFSNTFIKNLGADITIGTKTDTAEPLDKTIPYEYYQNEIMRWLEVVSLVGATTKHINPYITVTKNDTDEAKKVLQNNKKFIIIHPGATDSKRRWPAERFAEVGDYFMKKGFRIIVTGSGNEKEVVDGVLGYMHTPGDNFYNKLSLNGFAGLLAMSAVVISNDTGPLHLADAVGAKTVGLYWCANIINAAPPFRSRATCLSSWMTNCPLCKTDCASGYPFDTPQTACRHEVSFVSKIGVADVITAAEKMISVH